MKFKVLISLIVLIGGYLTLRFAWETGSEYYFEKKCEAEGGEFIYKTVDNVEGVFQMRLRDPRDYVDTLRKGLLVEDPYGHTNFESSRPEGMFLGRPHARYRFFENVVIEPTTPIVPGAMYRRYHFDEKSRRVSEPKYVTTLQSRYGYTWREIRKTWDRFFGVWGGEVVVKDLKTDETLGIRRGFFYKNRMSGAMRICPADKKDIAVYEFVSKILIPIEPTLSENPQ